MKISNVQNSKDNLKVTFTLEGATPAFANTLRRLYMEEVPTMAIEEVEFKDNSSILYDETVAHRLGLLPIKTDLSTYKLREEVEGGGEGSAECELKVSISTEGPRTVYAEDFKIDDPASNFVHPKTPIVKLIEGQKLEMHAVAILGKGKEHTKWSPGHMFYSYEGKTEKNESVNCNMTVESWGQLSCKEALVKATQIFDQKLEAFSKGLEK